MQALKAVSKWNVGQRGGRGRYPGRRRSIPPLLSIHPPLTTGEVEPDPRAASSGGQGGICEPEKVLVPVVF